MTAPRLEPGQILNNRFRLERLLGKGGMGQVFLARDLSTGKDVALKTLTELVEEGDRKRFEREIRTLQTLQHPHIIPFQNIGWAGDSAFYTMDYLAGATLEEVLAAHGKCKNDEEIFWLLRLILQVCEALTYLHGKRIVHRDVKPSNILLTVPHADPATAPIERWMKTPHVAACLTDFGLAKTREADPGFTRVTMGTPQYMSPEQIEASPSVDERSDLYSLGVILYRAMTMKLPFERLSDALSRRPATPVRELNPAVPEPLENLIRRLLDFEPFRRPASAEEVSDELRAIVEHPQEPAVGVPTPVKRAQPAFCGRGEELKTLKEAVHDVARGEGRWVCITGERGTGKTWLVARSDLKTHTRVEERVAVYFGAFDPRKPRAGFQEVLRSILRHIERQHGSGQVVEVLGRWGAHLKNVFPELAQQGIFDDCPDVEESVPPEVFNERVFETVNNAFTAFAEVEPRMIVLEDLHFLDDFDLELLHRFIIHALSLPVLLVTTHRSEGGERLRPLERLLKETRVEERLVEIELRPFGDEEVREMVSSLLTPERLIPKEFVEVLLERTDGVPLYVLHLVNSLWNRQMVRLTPAAWQVDPEQVRKLPIPESTRSHFLLLLEELPPEEVKVLHVAAVLGTRFAFEALSKVLEIDEFELDAVCRNLVHAGLFVEHQDGFRFQHAFEQEIILSRLSRPMFRRLHLRVGKVLVALHESDLEKHLGEIAEHLYQGGDQERGLDYLRRAAQNAVASYSHRAALGYYSKALELAQEPLVRRDLVSTIGELYIHLGEPELALERFREAILHFTTVEDALLEPNGASDGQRGELEAYAKLLLRFGEVYHRQGNFAPALENFEKSERIYRRIQKPEGIAFALVRQGGAHYALEDTARAEEAYTKSVAIYQEIPPSSGLAVALTGLGLVEKMRGNFEQALEHTTAGLEIAQKIGDSMQTAGLLNNFGIIYRSLGRLQEAVEAFERSIEIRERLGERQGLARCFMNLGRVQSSLGDFRRGFDALSRARELFHAIGDKKGSLLTLGNLGMLQFYLGDFKTAIRYFQEYLQDSRRLGSLRGEADALNSLGLVELELENYSQAEECFERSLRIFEQAGDREGIVVNRIQLARVRGRQGEIDEALRMLESARAQAAGSDFPEAMATAGRVEAEARRVQGDLEQALACAQQALASFEAQTHPYNQGTCCRSIAKIYRDMGFYWADQAGKHFERALRIFEMIGARHALAVTQVEHGIFLGLLEEFTGARFELEKARQVFEELGIINELARVEEELKAMGAGT